MCYFRYTYILNTMYALSCHSAYEIIVPHVICALSKWC